MKRAFNCLTSFSVKLVERFLPDAFIFAILLTFLVAIASLTVGNAPIDIVEAWYGGFWELLTFAMQMALILVTGTILATAPASQKLLDKLSSIPKNKIQAVIYVNIVALVASFINWGFGLVIGAIYAKQVARKIKNVDYPLLVAAAYSGFIVWHAGLSGSIPLKIASSKGLEAITNGAITEPISTSLTIFSASNLIIVAVILFTLPFVLSFMHPKEEDTKSAGDKLEDETSKQKDNLDKSQMTIAQKLENSRIINILLSVFGFAYIIKYFIASGFSLNLNIVNFTFLFTAILLHGTPIKVVRAVNEAVKNVGGIILQFPFYAGIMGMMVAKSPDGVSLAGAVSDFFVSISNQDSFAIFTFLSAGIVNIFVPSGGGQWAVQAPIMMPASVELGVNAAKTAMAIAWGDAWTNMIQPFWALPILGIAKLGARDIMGYCLVVLLYTGIIIGIGLLIL